MAGQIQPTSRAAATRGAVRRPPAQLQTSLTPKEILGILRRHVLLVVVLTIIGTAAGVGLWYLCRMLYPRYTAVGAIQVLQPETTDPMQFGGARLTQDIYDQFRNSKVLRMKSLGILQELLRRDSVRGTSWFKQFVRGNQIDISRAIKNLQRNLRAVAPRDDIHILVSMKCASPAESQLIVNEMINLFLRLEEDTATKDLRDQLSQRRTQQSSLRVDLEVSNDEMRRIREGTEFGNLGETRFRDFLTETLADQQTDLGNLQNEIIRLDSAVAILQTRAQGDFDEVITERIEEDPIARRMRDSIAALEPVLAELLTRFGENHRRVKEVSDALRQRRDDLARRQAEIAEIMRRADYANAQDQLVTLTAEVEAQKTRLQELQAEHKEMSKVRADYLDAMTERDEKQARLEEMTTHIEKLTTLINDPQTSKVKSAWQAPEPIEMSFPRLAFFLPGGFILGLLAGLGLAFAIELLNDLVRSPSDVVRHLRVPLLGMICHVDEDHDVNKSDLAHVVRRAPYSIMSECYRQFRTNLQLTGPDGDKKVLLITSGGAGDGKTTLAANLAATLVSGNSKVLLIDANFRRPMSAVLFPRAVDDKTPSGADWRLSNYLTGQCPIDTGLIRSSGMEDFDIIDSGPVPGNPAEMLGSVRMQELLIWCRKVYDFVIIDGPPLIVSDAKTLAARTDGVVLVFDAESTHRGAAQRLLRELAEINAFVVGTVLMRVKAMKGGYFQEIFRSYQDYQRTDRVKAAV